MAKAIGANGDGRGPGQPGRGRRDDDSAVAGYRIGALRRAAALGPRDVDAARGIDGHRLKGVRAERRRGRTLIEGTRGRDADRLGPGRSGVRGPRHHHGVFLRAGLESAPRNVDGAVRGIDRDLRVLIQPVADAEILRRAPGLPTVTRAREHDGRLLGGSRTGKGTVGDVDVPGRDDLGDVGAIALRDLQRAGGAGARYVDGERRLVEKARTLVLVDDARVEISDGIARLEVVQIHVARDKDRARLAAAAIEGEPGVVEQPVGAGADNAVGRCLPHPDRRGLPFGRGVLWIAGDQGAEPRLAAVE